MAFQVPTAAGDWIAAKDALFSRPWGATTDELLEAFISKASENSNEFDSLTTRLLPAPGAWPFEIDDQARFREFLERLGVRSGLWPMPLPRSELSREGYYFKQLAAHTRVDVPASTRAQWRAVLARHIPDNLRPNTIYRSAEPQYVLPGQSAYETFDDATRRLYAKLIVLGVAQWEPTMLDTVVSRYNNSADRFSWPTPVRAFLEEVDWVPMARSRERQDWYYVKPSEAWSLGFGESSAATFAPLIPHPLRQLIEQERRARARLEQLGVRFWDSPDTASDRVRVLPELVRNGEIPDNAAAALRKAYEEAWEDVVKQGAANPLLGEDEPWVVATRRGQLVAVPLNSTADGDPIYVQDIDSQVLRLLEQRPIPVVRLRGDTGGSVAGMLADVGGARVRRLSETKVTVRVDGQSFDPKGQGELLADGRWLVDLVACLTEFRSGRFLRVGPAALRRTRETVQRTRLVLAENIETLVDGAPVEGTSRALAFSDPLQPTIVLARSAAPGQADLLQAAAPALAELIGYPDLADTLRVSLLDLAQREALGGDGPTYALMAEIIGESESRLREVIAGASDSIRELARMLVPLVATFDPHVATELWSSLDSFADEAAMAEWLSQRAAPDVGVPELMSLAKIGDLDAARVALGITLPDLNAAIASVGPPFEPLSNPDGIDQAFRHYLSRHRDAILDALRDAFRAAYDAFEPLDAYIARRDLTALQPDPKWVDEHYELPDGVLRKHVEDWLLEVDAKLSDGEPTAPRLDDLRRSNRAELRKFVITARSLIGAWETRTGCARSVLLNEPDKIVDLATASGQLDFEPLTAERAVAWLCHTDHWPADVPRSLDPSEVGVDEADLDEAKQRREEEARRRQEATRQLSIDGEVINAEQQNYPALVDAIRAGLTPEVLASPPKVADLPVMPVAARRSGSGGGGRVTAARNPGLSDVQKSAVGLVGEVVALEWLKAHYEDATDLSWRSGYRNLVLGGNEGDDSLGYDFEVHERQKRLLFEVKASVGGACEFDLSPAEIRAAQTLRRRDRYYILYIAHVLTSDERAIHLLPNPFSDEGRGRYRTIGAGLRLRFELAEGTAG